MREYNGNRALLIITIAYYYPPVVLIDSIISIFLIIRKYVFVILKMGYAFKQAALRG